MSQIVGGIRRVDLAPGFDGIACEIVTSSTHEWIISQDSVAAPMISMPSTINVPDEWRTAARQALAN